MKLNKPKSLFESKHTNHEQVEIMFVSDVKPSSFEDSNREVLYSKKSTNLICHMKTNSTVWQNSPKDKLVDYQIAPKSELNHFL